RAEVRSDSRHNLLAPRLPLKVTSEEAGASPLVLRRAQPAWCTRETSRVRRWNGGQKWRLRGPAFQPGRQDRRRMYPCHCHARAGSTGAEIVGGSRWRTKLRVVNLCHVIQSRCSMARAVEQ